MTYDDVKLDLCVHNKNTKILVLFLLLFLLCTIMVHATPTGTTMVLPCRQMYVCVRVYTPVLECTFKLPPPPPPSVQKHSNNNRVSSSMQDDSGTHRRVP